MGVLLWRGFDAQQGFLLLTTLGLGAAYFYTYSSAPVYPISMRRLISDVIPLMALLAGYAVAALGEVRASAQVRRGVQASLAAVALLWTGALSLPLLAQHEARDEVADVAALHNQLPDEAVVLFEPQDADSWIGWLAAPLYTLYGDWALLLESDTPEPDALALAIDEFTAAERTVLLASQSDPAPAALVPPGYEATPVYAASWRSSLIGRHTPPTRPRGGNLRCRSTSIEISAKQSNTINE